MRYFQAVLSLGRIHTLRETALTAGALLGSLCIVASLLAAAFDIKPLVFRSGSMQPAISTGALAFAKEIPAADIKIGDIVSVENRYGTRVTHRVESADLEGGRAILILKGDANALPDAEPYAVTTADRVFFDIPEAGYVVTWLVGPAGIFGGGLLVGLLLFVAFGPGSRRDRVGKRRAGAAGAFLAVGLAGFGGSGAMGATPTVAAFQDTATTTSGYSAHTVLPPDSVTCSGGGLLASLTYTWPNKDVRYTYKVDLVNSSGTTVNTATKVNNGTAGANQSHTYTFSQLQGFLGVPATFTVKVSSYLTAATTWVSLSSRNDTGSLSSIAFIGLSSSC